MSENIFAWIVLAFVGVCAIQALTTYAVVRLVLTGKPLIERREEPRIVRGTGRFE